MGNQVKKEAKTQKFVDGDGRTYTQVNASGTLLEHDASGDRYYRVFLESRVGKLKPA